VRQNQEYRKENNTLMSGLAPEEGNGVVIAAMCKGKKWCNELSKLLSQPLSASIFTKAASP